MNPRVYKDPVFESQQGFIRFALIHLFSNQPISSSKRHPITGWRLLLKTLYRFQNTTSPLVNRKNDFPAPMPGFNLAMSIGSLMQREGFPDVDV